MAREISQEIPLRRSCLEGLIGHLRVDSIRYYMH